LPAPMLINKKLILLNPLLLEGHDQFFAISDYVKRKVGPFKLRFIKHPF